MQIELTQSQIEQFKREGFVIVENVLSQQEIQAAQDVFPKLFRGEFETGIEPDEWNWREGRDDESLSRQICNGWKSSSVIASIVLRFDIGRACAVLRGWLGARINQDNLIWKPPGSKSLGFHQDDSYQDWIEPNEMMTCWITLDDTLASQGTIEYVRGSHRWPLSKPIQQFHAPENPLHDMLEAAASAGVSPEIVPIEVVAGTAVFHHGRTWHGSRENYGSHPRRSVVAHCMSSTAHFHPTNKHPIYSRYQQADTLAMDESFFPILWKENGGRSRWLD